MSRLLVDPIDIRREIKKGVVEVSATQMDNPVDPLGSAPINLEWLRFAAREYMISPNIRDYLLVPVIIVPVEFPNRNGMAFKLEDLVRFSPEYGCQFYKTWIGKPTYYEHNNTDVTQANGVVMDIFLRQSSLGDYWKILAFLAFDRSKYVDRVKRIANKDLNNYSMGAMVTGGYTCSICDRKLGNCTHVSKASRQITIDNGNLAYRVGRNPVGFEVSAVETPAWTVANSDTPHLIDPNAEYIG